MEQMINKKQNSIRNAYQEVYVILQDLNMEEYNKIPNEIIETLRKNRNEEYVFELDDDLELKDHKMLFETKVILFNIFRDYLASPEQKEKIIKMQNEARWKNEQKKKQLYNTNIFEDKQKENINVQEEQEPKQMVEYKENILRKIMHKITKFLDKNRSK